MKPLLIVPPAPARWPMVESLLQQIDRGALDELRRRICEGLPDAYDAFAIVPEGNRAIAHACIYRRRDRGVLRYVWTSPEHRRRGCALRVLSALTTWFDMTGGRVLYSCGLEDIAAGLLGPTGFSRLHRTSEDSARAVYSRGQLPDAPLDAPIEIRAATLADFPLLVEMLQFLPGHDPRVPLHDSAVAAEQYVHELLEQQTQGRQLVFVALLGPRIVELANAILEPAAGRAFANVTPHGAPAAELRAAVTAAARQAGISDVSFGP